MIFREGADILGLLDGAVRRSRGELEGPTYDEVDLGLGDLGATGCPVGAPWTTWDPAAMCAAGTCPEGTNLYHDDFFDAYLCCPTGSFPQWDHSNRANSKCVTGGPIDYAAWQGKIYTRTDGSQCLIALNTCVDLAPCTPPLIHRDDPGWNPAACSPPPAYTGPLPCSPGYHWVSMPGTPVGGACVPDCVLPDGENGVVLGGYCLKELADGTLVTPRGSPLPSWLPPGEVAAGLTIATYGAGSAQLKGKTTSSGWVNYNTDWVRVFNLDGGASFSQDITSAFPEDGVFGYCKAAKYPLGSAGNRYYFPLVPCINFEEHGQPLSAELARYRDYILQDVANQWGVSSQKYQGILSGNVAFAHFQNLAQTRRAPPSSGVLNGKSGTFYFDNWMLYSGTSTGGKLILEYRPYFDADWDPLGWLEADAMLHYLGALGGAILDAIKAVFCNDFSKNLIAAAVGVEGGGQAGAKAAKTALDVGCALIGGGGGGGGGGVSGGSALPWLIGGGVVALLGGLTYFAVRK